MTKEIALKKVKGYLTDYFSITDYNEVEEIMLALEQQPCEDCISRKAIINELKLGYFNKDLQEGKNDPCVIDAMIDWAIRAVKRQPSTTPQQKMGRWITRTFMHDGEFYCDKCKCDSPYNEKWDYCPNCGAKMEVEG